MTLLVNYVPLQHLCMELVLVMFLFWIHLYLAVLEVHYSENNWYLSYASIHICEILSLDTLLGCFAFRHWSHYSSVTFQEEISVINLKSWC